MKQYQANQLKTQGVAHICSATNKKDALKKLQEYATTKLTIDDIYTYPIEKETKNEH